MLICDLFRDIVLNSDLFDLSDEHDYYVETLQATSLHNNP
jgi:hypothetical protein